LLELNYTPGQHYPAELQIIMATHSPLLMAYPGAQLLRLSKYGLEPVTVEETEHFQIMREFWTGPAVFMKTMLEE
jgi:predicted ATPase